jgi:hypothetical protein
VEGSEARSNEPTQARAGRTDSDTATMIRRWLRSIRGEHIAFTGKAWISRKKLRRLVRRKGGIPTAGAEVTRTTTVLVRGHSSVWVFGEYGTKELDAVRLIRKGASISIVHDFEFRKLIEQGHRARIDDRVAGEPVQWIVPATKPQFEDVARISGELDREHTVLGRLEQSYLRLKLFGAEETASCSLCGRRLPVALLVAAHVKPRSECSRRERLDVENIVTSMCLLGCDALYERGLIAVSDGGQILASTAVSSSGLNHALRRFPGRMCKTWNSETAKYFNWHVERRFQGTH